MHCVWEIFQKILQLITGKKTGLKGVVQYFCVNFNPIDTNILDIHRYSMIQNVWVNSENIYWVIN